MFQGYTMAFVGAFRHQASKCMCLSSSCCCHPWGHPAGQIFKATCYFMLGLSLRKAFCGAERAVSVSTLNLARSHVRSHRHAHAHAQAHTCTHMRHACNEFQTDLMHPHTHSSHSLPFCPPFVCCSKRPAKLLSPRSGAGQQPHIRQDDVLCQDDWDVAERADGAMPRCSRRGSSHSGRWP